MKEVASFSIKYQQILNQQGELVGELPSFAKEKSQLIHLYRYMLMARRFDAKAIALQRTGLMYTYASSYGQEAVASAIGAVLNDDDEFVPAYRESAAMFQRGVRPSEILAYWGGDERGSDYQAESARRDYPLCVPLATQCLHAAGIACVKKIKKQDGVVIAVIGDGATSEGSFYEAVNLSGVWDLPIIFVVNNNQWAISVPRSSQSGAQTMAQKGFAGGLDVLQVDGNDVIAMQDALEKAKQYVNENRKPFLIEALTYRLGDHTTADDATRYRDEQEWEEAKAKDPIPRMKNYLQKNHGWDDAKDEALLAEIATEIDAEVKLYKSADKPKATNMFDYLYESLPTAYQEQYEELEGQS